MQPESRQHRSASCTRWLNNAHHRYNPVVIELRNVTLTAGQRHLLNNFNWRMEDPDTYLLLGPNASGKSLLSNVLAGRLRPRRGQVTIDGGSVYSMVGHYSEPVYIAEAALPCLESDPLDLYLQSEIAAAGGNRQALKANWPVIEEQLDTARDTPVNQLAHSQVLLAQVALAGLLPVRLAILDGHLTYLDHNGCQAAERLLNLSDQSEKFCLFTAARLAGSFARSHRRFVLSGQLPVEISELAADQTLDTDLAVPTGGPALRVYTVDSPFRLRGLASGSTFTLVSQLEDGLRISLKTGLDGALAELAGLGLMVRAIEWETNEPKR